MSGTAEIPLENPAPAAAGPAPDPAKAAAAAVKERRSAAANSKQKKAHPLTGVAAVFLSLVIWVVLAYSTNVLVNRIIGATWDRWLRWQGVTVLVVTLIAALWAVSRVVDPAEKFD